MTATAATRAGVRRPGVLHRLEYGVLRAAIAGLRLLPLQVAAGIGAALGVAVYHGVRLRRRVVVRQLAAAFPDRSGREIRRLARDVYAHFGRVLIESAFLPALGREGVLALVESAEGVEALRSAAAEGRGVVLITGHFGNWELAGAWVAALGIPIEVIVRRMNNPLFDAWLTATREGAGMRVVYDADAVRRAPRAFREGHAVAFVADQGVRGLASTHVPFFGRPAKTPRGPAVFALRAGLPTFFVAVVRGANGRYRGVVTPVEIAATGDREADVDATVARFTGILEGWVRRHPEQYFWHHRRWKRQPADTPPALRDPVLHPPKRRR